MRDTSGDQPAYMLEDEDTVPAASRERSLLRMVERHVLPRLAERLPSPSASPSASLPSPSLLLRDRFGDGLAGRIGTLADLALAADDARAMALLHRLNRGGRSFSDLQLGLIAPAARRLNLLWERDDVTFVDVTLAVATLKRLMGFVALDLMPAHPPQLRHLSVLVASAPGDDHNFGAAMAAEYFRRDGWSVRHMPGATAEALVHAVAGEWVDAAALSLTTRERAESLAGVIRALRQSALNPRLLVLVGGEAVTRVPALVSAVGADATAAPLASAPARTHRLVRAMFGVAG